MRYLIVVEKTGAGYSAYTPDLEGCVAVGSTQAEVERNMREAIESHLEGLKQEGVRVSPPTTYSTFVDVPG